MNNVTEPALPMGGFDSLHMQSIVRVIEASVQVRRRHQFFSWTQSYLQSLVPHQLAVCGAYHRGRRDVVYDAFHSIAIPHSLLSALGDGGSQLVRELISRWSERCERVLCVEVQALSDPLLELERKCLLAIGFEELLMHGVCRPQRSNEVESVFILGAAAQRSTPQQRVFLELLMPHLHSTWLRVQATERDLAGAAAADAAPPARTEVPGSAITDRERQILSWVREGMNNQEIGAELGISALTVKNHVQKILRKLGAANRAQAVAKAMTQNLLVRVHGGTR